MGIFSIRFFFLSLNKSGYLSKSPQQAGDGSCLYFCWLLVGLACVQASSLSASDPRREVFVEFRQSWGDYSHSGFCQQGREDPSSAQSILLWALWGPGPPGKGEGQVHSTCGPVAQGKFGDGERIASYSVPCRPCHLTFLRFFEVMRTLKKIYIYI